MAAPSSPTFDALLRTVSAGHDLRPVYLLHGKEGYYIDRLVQAFESLVPDDMREFALTNVYAPQVDNPRHIIDLCRSLPMMTDRQVIIVREAQSARADFIDRLAPYVLQPTQSTILVVASRGDSIKGKEFKTAVQKTGIVFESKEVWPSQIPALISSYIKSKGLKAHPKAEEMLADFIGANLSRLYNEIDKLAQILEPGATITPDDIERNIGVSKDYNTFELLDALAARDSARANTIVRYFAANPKANPYVVLTPQLFNFFADVLQMYYTKDDSDRALMAELGLKPNNVFALRRLRKAKSNYTARQAIEILDAVRTFDAMSKGVGSRQDPYRLLSDLTFHILTAPGQLPV